MDFQDYFGEEVEEDEKVEVDNKFRTSIKYDKEEPALVNTYKLRQLEELESTGFLQKDEDISDIDTMCLQLGKLLDKAWGAEWGIFGPDLTNNSEDSDEVILPQITYDYNYRKIPDNFSKKPALYKTVKEVIDGKATGDAFKVYRQWFDYILEFQFWGKSSLEARTLMKNFESLMNQSTAYLRHHGVSYIAFLEECDARNSKKFRDDVPMRQINFMVRLENIEIIRVSTLQSIQFNAELI